MGNSATSEILDAVNGMREEGKKRHEESAKRIGALEDRMKAVSAQRHTGATPAAGNTWVNRGAPNVRKGADLMGSKGFSFVKLIKGLEDASFQKDAAFEFEFCNRVAQHTKDLWGNCFRPYHEKARYRVLAPLWSEAFASEGSEGVQMAHEMKSMLEAAVAGYDPEEAWAMAKEGKAIAAGSPAMSATDATVGGSFVPPPRFGDPIELLRNVEVMLRAGATIVPLGPSGSVVFPRLLQATQGSMVAENTAQQPVNPGTGELVLKNKKVMATCIFPGEWLRFATPTAEQMVRNDLLKTVALIADKQYLEGPGSDTQIYGLATMGSKGELVTITPTNANQLAPQDCYEFLSAIEENNGKATSWIMRPKMKYAFAKSRWTPYSGGTSQGGFVFEFGRPFDDNPMKEPNPMLAGVKITDSAQVSNMRGTGAQTYMLALWASDYYVALFGAIELMTTDQGLNLVSSDQVLIRAILTTDGGPRHPSCVSFCDNLNFVIAG
jgi:HK97 family phage major capsid protein